VRSRLWLVVVAVLSIATLAVGLRVGAGNAVRAAVVYGAPLPAGGGHATWQLRTEVDDGRERTAVATAFTATVRARGVTRTIRGTTNDDGVAEVAFDAPGLAAGDDVEIEVRDARGALLARGNSAWPEAPPRREQPRGMLRPTRIEGTLRLSVAVLGARLAPGQAGRVWVKVDAAGEPPRDPRVDATPDPGLDLTSPFAAAGRTCPGWGVVEVTPRGHIGGLLLSARDALGRTGEWYGAMPIAAGAMHVHAPLFAAPGPVKVVIVSASARAVAYAELDDAKGRAAAAVLPLAGEPPTGEVTFDATEPGLSWLVVSGEPDGAVAMRDATRAMPLWIGPGAPCEADLAGIAPASFERFVALDGFVRQHALLAARRRRGRLIALGALALGSLLETLLLLRAAREGRRGLAKLEHALGEAEGLPAPPTARGRAALDLLAVLLLSALGFALLFALVEWQSR
jgi:hypothetical protein